MKVSIVIPVLNEAPQIRPFLRHLRQRAPQAEIIVVDGGSNDGTLRLAEGLCDLLLKDGRGRATQMNAGAAVARGEILWFLHADNEIPESAVQTIANSMDQRGVAGGCFRIRILRPEWIYRIHDGLAHHVGRLIHVRCGDHGIFVRRSVFEQIGGYPDVPLMEDASLFRTMHRHGRISWSSDRLLLSCRRHIQVGVYRYTAVCSLIVTLFVFGLSLERLASVYRRLVVSRQHRTLNPVELGLFSEFRQRDDQ